MEVLKSRAVCREAGRSQVFNSLKSVLYADLSLDNRMQQRQYCAVVRLGQPTVLLLALLPSTKGSRSAYINSTVSQAEPGTNAMILQCHIPVAQLSFSRKQRVQRDIKSLFQGLFAAALEETKDTLPWFQLPPSYAPRSCQL